MSDVGTVRGQLVLDDKFTPVLDHASASIMGFGTNLNNMSRGIMSIAGNFNYLKGSIAGLGIRRLAEEVIQAQQATDRMKASLMVATGSMKLVGEELSFVRQEANRLGLDFASVAQGYGQFAAASKNTGISAETVRATFVAVSEAATVLGLSSEKTAGALNAIQQMMTKGTVQAEELRGQLGDRIPGAVQLMARSLNVTTAELNKMFEAGQIITAEVLPQFAAAMHDLYSPGVATAAKSLTAEINRTKTSFYDLLMVVADNIGLKNMTLEIGNLIRAFTELGRLKGGDVIEAIGTSTTAAIGIVSNLVGALNQVLGLLERIKGKAGEGEGGSLIGSPKQFTAAPIQLIAEALDGLNTKMRDGGIVFEEWKKGVIEGFAAVARGVDMASGKFAAAGAFGSIQRPNDPSLVGPPAPTNDQRAAMNAAVTRENSEIIKKMIKDAKELDRTMGDAFDLKDKLEDQKMEMKAFAGALKDTKGDFDKAKKYAKAYYDVLKAGLDPLKGMGKELYNSAKAIEDQKVAFDRAEDAQKEYLKGIEHMDSLRDQYFEKQKKRDAAAKKAADTMSARMKNTLDELKDQVDGEMNLMLAREHGADAIRDAARELEILRIIQEKMPDGIKRGTDEYNAFAQQIRDTVEPMLLFRDAQDKILTDHQELADAFRSMDWGSDGLNKAADGVGDFIEALGRLRAVQDATSKEAASAWAGMLTGINAVLEATGAYAGGGSGGFGGSPEGNYAEEGAMVGAIIGGIIGAFVGAPQVGMAIGSAAGGMLGGFVKKGADEALATITIDTSGFTDSFTLNLGKAEGDLGGAMNSLGQSIITSVQDIVAAIGGTIEGMPQVSMKIRDGVIGVLVGGVKGKFKEMDDAISFAVSELLKQGQISGLDEMVQAVLQGTTSSSLEGLTNDLQAVMQVLSFGMTDSQQAIQGFTGELDTLRSQMTRMIGDSDQLARALGNINEEEVRRWQSTRDQITGEQRTNAEKLAMLKRDGEMWNAEKALRVAELQQRKADLEAKFAMAQAQVDLFNADQKIGNMKYEFDLFKLRAEGKLLDNTGEMYRAELELRNSYTQASMVLLQAQIDAVGKVIDALANMPDIDVPNLHLPNVGGGHGGSAGPSEAEQRAQAFNDFIRGYALVGLSEYQTALAQLTAAFAAQAQAAREITGGEEALAEARRIAMNQLREDLFNSMGLPMESVRDRMALLVQQADDFYTSNLELQRQWDEGEITFEEWLEAIRRSQEVGQELRDQARQDIANQMLFFTDAMGMDEESIQLRKDLADMEWAIKLAEFKLTVETYYMLKRISEEMYQTALNLIDKIEDWVPSEHWDITPPDNPRDQVNVDHGNPLLDALNQALDRLRSAIENLTRSNENLVTSSVSPLSIRDQFLDVQRRYNETLAAARGGDVGAIEDFAGIRDEYLALAAAMFGTSGAGYQSIFQQSLQAGQDLAAAGQAILDAVPPQMQGVETRLDTIAEILAAMASQMHVRPIWNPGPHGAIPTNYPPSIGNVGNVAYGNFNGTGYNRDAAVVEQLKNVNENLIKLSYHQERVASETRNDRMMRPRLSHNSGLVTKRGA